MAEFIEWLNGEEEISPVFVAGVAQFRFVDIHPFLDGNGRTARLLCTPVLYQKGYDFKRLFSLSEYYDKNRPQYYEAIQSVRESNGDQSGWLEYFTEGLSNQLADVKVKGSSSMKRDLLAERIGGLGLNDRQIMALEYLVDNPRIDNTGYQRLCDTIKRTASRDLAHLVELGLLERHGEKKGTYYTPNF